MAVDTPEAMFSAVLRHDVVPWSGGTDAAALRHLAALARHHGVAPLLAARFAQDRAFDHWPSAFRAECRDAMRRSAAHDLAQRAELARVIGALTQAGVQPLILKGAALACTHYPNPALRPRTDADVLIRADARDAACAALAALGYARDEANVEGELISQQSNWQRAGGSGPAHRIDLHWRIHNSPMLADALGYDELAQRAIAVPALASGALTPCPVDALLFACIHRAGHAHAPFVGADGESIAGDRLIWLYDVHLLVARMSAVERDDFAQRAAAKRIRTICRDALAHAAAQFATPIPEATMRALAVDPAGEPSACLLDGSRARQMLGDFLALGRWRDRRRWLAELAFPSAAYMRSKYPDARASWLPLLYARRGASALARMVRHR